jgi:hypothetical protein
MSDLISTTLNLLVDCATLVYSLVGTQKENEHILDLHREIQDVQAVVTSMQDLFKQKSIGAAMQRHIGELEKCISSIRAHIKGLEAKRQATLPKKVFNSIVDFFDKKVHGNSVDVAETLSMKERITKIKVGIAFELRAKSLESQSNLNEQMASLLETLRQKTPAEYYELFKDIFESQKKLYETEFELQKKVVDEYRTYIDDACAVQARLIEEKLDVVRRHFDAFAQFESHVEEKLQEHQVLLTQMKERELDYKEKVADLKMQLADQRIEVAELKNEIVELKKNMAAVHQRIDEMTIAPPVSDEMTIAPPVSDEMTILPPVSLSEKICLNLNLSYEEITPDCIEILPVGTQFIFFNTQSNRTCLDFKDCCGRLHFIQNNISLLETQYEERTYQHVSVDRTLVFSKGTSGWPYFSYQTITGQAIVYLSHNCSPYKYAEYTLYGYDGKIVYQNKDNQVTQFRMFYYPNNGSNPNKLITYPTKESPDTLVKYVPINLKIFYILRIDEAFPEIGHFSFGLDYILINRKCNNRVDKNLFIDLLENPTCRHKFNESVEFYNSSGLLDSRLDIPNRTLFFYEHGKIVGTKKMTEPSIYFARYN